MTVLSANDGPTTVDQPHLTDTPSQHGPRGRSMSITQRIVVAVAALPLVGIVLTTIAGALGIISVDQMTDTAVALGEEPGMFTFAAMLWCSPIQSFVKRTQVPVRKALGILFGGYAVSNFVMFAIGEGLAESLSAPFLVAGTVAMLLSMPLVLTSGRWAQRRMGMRNWRKLHKLTYLIALALVLHVALVGEIGLSGVLIVGAMIARIPKLAATLAAFGERMRERNVVDRFKWSR